MSKILLLSLVSLACASAAHANPRAKLCRGSAVAARDFEEYQAAEKGASEKAACFQVGRLTGGVEENMTFKAQARKNLTPEILALADEMVSRAVALRGFCGVAAGVSPHEPNVPEGDRAELNRQLGDMFGTGALNSRINGATCQD